VAPSVASFTPGAHPHGRQVHARAADSKPAPRFIEERTARRRSEEQPLAFAACRNLISSTLACSD
jgi:hypothetical protein